MSLHGDRYFGDDKAIVGGLASIGGRPVTVIGQQKDAQPKKISNEIWNAITRRIQKIPKIDETAEKFHRPIISL